MGFVERLMKEPAPIRKAMKAAIRRSGIGSYRFRLEMGAVARPHYGYIIYQAAQLAARLGKPSVSVIEYGVAGGNGLKSMEFHAEQVEKLFPVKIEIYGFDTGEGLPAPKDYRDLPYHWKPGFYKMDLEALQGSLKRARLVLGDVAETSKDFFETYNPAPIGAVSHDLDFYSSTVSALDMFLVDDRWLLPRIFCYFDDTIGGDVELYGDFTGERLAIRDFNARNGAAKLSPPYYLRTMEHLGSWRHQIWICHLVQHRDYNRFISAENQQQPLKAD